MNQSVPVVIKENDDYLVVNKPAGLLVHGDGRSDEATLADWLIENFPDIKEVGEPWHRDDGAVIYRPGIVHRLDRDTSGVMVVARTEEMFQVLKQQFKDRQIEKEYVAIVYGYMKDDTGVIDAPIGKSRSDFRRWSASRGARGQLREAQTEYVVLKRFTDEMGNKFTYVKFMPKTGRTHQIRVHAKHINYPIVGDELYAGKNIRIGQAEAGVYALGFMRQALHAYALCFYDLVDSKHCYEAEIPADFETALLVAK